MNPANLAQQKTFKKYKNSLTLANVMKYAALIDKAITMYKNAATEGYKDIVVNVNDMDCSPNTFRVGLYGARRYLAQHFDTIPAAVRTLLKHSKDDYSVFQQIAKLKADGDKLSITFPGCAIFKAFNTVNPCMDRATWKNELLAFLNNPSETMYKLEEISFSADDLDYIKSILSDVKCQYKLETNLLMIVKE